MFQKNIIKTQNLCSTNSSENRAVYEIMCNNIVEPGRPQMAIKHGEKKLCMINN